MIEHYFSRTSVEDKKFKSPFASASAGALAPPAGRHGAHMAYETTHVVVDLGDPVPWDLASTGRRDGRWVYSTFQMAEDRADHFALRHDGDEPQSPALTPRAVHQ